MGEQSPVWWPSASTDGRDVGPESTYYQGNDRGRLVACMIDETDGNLRSMCELAADAAQLAGAFEAEMRGLAALLALWPGMDRHGFTVSGVRGGEAVVVTSLSRVEVGGRREWSKIGSQRMRMRATDRYRLVDMMQRAPMWVQEAAHELGVEVGGGGDG